MPEPTAPSACPCCASPQPEHRGQKWSVLLRREFHYYRCPVCAYLWVEPFPGYEIYNEDYYQGRGPDPYVDYASEYADYRRTDRLLEFTDLWRLAQAHFQPAPTATAVRWLDFGCGAGGLLKFLRDQPAFTRGSRPLPVEIHGHDIGTYADRLQQVDRFSILSREELAAATGTFDVISCIEVVEHVREVHEVFATLARLLRPGGLLLLTTGNLTSPAARMAGLNYRYLLPEFHISLLNPDCLNRLYRQNGLQPLPVRYDGAVQFKVIKSLPQPGLKRLARFGLNLPQVTRAIDKFYGVSAMPCATKLRLASPLAG
ncbi:MAG: class I SAM-dependent methyltransferase [Opitutae bacterium]